MKKSKKLIAVIFHDSDRFYSGGTRSMLDLLDNWKDDKSLSLLAVFPSDGSAADYIRTLDIPVIISKYYTNKKPRGIKGVLYLKELIKYIIKLIVTIFNVNKKIIPELKSYNVDFIYSNTSINFIGVLIKKKINKPLIWHIREAIEYNQFAHMWGGMGHFYKKVNKYADKVIFISKALAQIYDNNIRKELVEIVYDDISPMMINPEKSPTDKVNVLIAGFIDSSKGQLFVIKVVNNLIKKGLDKLNLYIAGNGNPEYLKQITNYIKCEGIENQVYLLGNIEDMNSLRKKMHIGIVATKFEAFGRVSIEGMLSKMAMVGSDCGANPELYNYGKTGLLFEWGNDIELSKLIEYLYENTQARLNLSELGFSYAFRFTEGAGALKIKRIIEQI